MKTETINDYGQRNGYPIYVFDDGTVAPYRQPGKNLLYEVSGPVSSNLTQKVSATNKPTSLLQKGSAALAKIVNAVLGRAEKKSQNRPRNDEPKYAEYETISEDDMRMQMLKSIPKVREMRKTGAPIKSFVIEQGDFRFVGFGMSDAEFFHRKIRNSDGSVDEISSACLKF